MTADRPIVVAIDGPSGVGKSTAARRLARRLGLAVLDTGAMYRTLALRVLEAGADPDDEAAVLAAIEDARVDVERRGDGVEVRLDGVPVGDRIRTPTVTDATSRISVHPAVRRRMVAQQRAWGEAHGAVVEGRDIGSVVFPDTPFKFFLDADPRVRAARRHRELHGDDETAGERLDRVAAELARRDARDRGRAESPLAHDDSYVVVDTSRLDPDAVVETMLRAIEERRAALAT